MHNPDELPIRRALIWIGISLVFVCAAFFITYFSIDLYESLRAENPRYTLRKIVPQAHRKLFIPASDFYHWLEIDPGQPVNLYAMSRAEMEKKLRKQPLLEKVRVTKQPPSTLVIDYWPRIPVATLADQTDTLLDSEGRALPFLSWMRKEEKEIYLGLDQPIEWGEKVDKWEQVRELIHLWKKEGEFIPLQLHQLDVSLIDANSAGEREVIFTLASDLGSLHFLRLSEKYVNEQLHHYISLCHHWLEQGEMERDWIIDLRIEGKALVKSEGRHE